MNVEFRVPPWAVQILSDFTDMDRNPHPVDASKVGRFTLELPDDAYFEYAFRDAAGELHPDPDNPERADSPWFPQASAVFGPDYRAHPLASSDPTLERGTLTRHRLVSAAMGQLRRVSVYTPGTGTGPLPLVIVQDGTTFLRLARLHLVLEALLEAGEVRPAHFAFVEPVDRTAEYGFDPNYRAFVSDELLPFLAAQHALSEERILWGASLGGLFSITFALHHPELADTVVTQSGAFLGTPTSRDFYREERSWVLEQLQDRPLQPFRIYGDVGTLEWLTGINRRVRDAVAAKGYRHVYAERNAGHNWVNWRNGLADALRFALAPEP